MDERYERAKALFLAVCDLDPPQQAAHLDKECAHEPELRAEVESLLANYGAPTAATAPHRAALSPKDPADGPARQRIGSYRVIRELGQGGMGVVYLGMRDDDQIKHRVAIKVMKRGMDTEQILHRFELERQLLAALNHPGIARLYDAGRTDDGLPYLVMEYVEGQPVDEYCDVHRLRIAERLELFRMVCGAVHYAHQNLIVHRDLKPDNIIVTSDGSPKLLDFGIAKILNPELSLIKGDPTAPEFRVMTPEYASPEQVRGYPITTGSDVYALGVLLYELMSGHRPYRLRSRVRAEIERAICEEEPEKPSTSVSRVESKEETDASKTTATITPESVSKVREGRPDRLRRRLAGDIDNIVLMAMRKEPQRRYVSAEQFSEDIRRHLDGLPVIAHGDSIGYRFTKFVRRHRAGVAAAAVIALSLFGGIVATSWQASIAADQRDVAQRAELAEAQQRLLAETERDRAERERATAERRFNQVRSLANTFMFDFHDAIVKLDGTIPARQLLVTTALEYLDALAQEVEADNELKRELAFAYDRVGEIRFSRRNPSLGDIPGALENYQQGLDLRRDLLAASPEDQRLRLEVSTSHIHIGDMLLDSGSSAEAVAAYREAMRLRQSLVTVNPRWRRDYAIILSALGGALLRDGKSEEAKQHYLRSLAIREELVAENPEDPVLQRDLSSIYLRVGGRFADAGDHQGALERYKQSVAVREQLLESDPDTGRTKRDLAVAHYFVAQTYLALNNATAAIDPLQHFVLATQQRAEDNPNIPRPQRDLAAAHELLGSAFAQTRDWDEARASFVEFNSVIRSLSEAHPANTLYRHMLASSYEHLGDVSAATGDPHDAINQFQQAINIVEALVAKDHDDVRWPAQRARTQLKLGAALAEIKDYAEAQLQLLAAQETYTSLMQTQSQDAQIRSGLVSALQELSRLMAALGQGAAALPYLEQGLEVAQSRTPSLLRDLAVAQHLAGHRDLAIQTAEEALGLLEQAPKTQDVDELRSKLQADLKQYRNEAVSLKKASWHRGIKA